MILLLGIALAQATPEVDVVEGGTLLRIHNPGSERITIDWAESQVIVGGGLERVPLAAYQGDHLLDLLVVDGEKSVRVWTTPEHDAPEWTRSGSARVNVAYTVGDVSEPQVMSTSWVGRAWPASGTDEVLSAQRSAQAELLAASERAARATSEQCRRDSNAAVERWNTSVQPIDAKMRAPRIAFIGGAILTGVTAQGLAAVVLIDPDTAITKPETVGLGTVGVLAAMTSTLGLLNLNKLAREKRSLGPRPIEPCRP